MTQIKFSAILFSILFSVFSPVYADDTNLVEIANAYNSEFLWGQELGEAPLIYSMSSIAEFESKVEELQSNLERLDAFSEEDKESQLWMDLKNYTEQELFVLRSCKPGVWDYAEAYQLSYFFGSAIHRLMSSETEINDTTLIPNLLTILGRLLDAYSDKVKASIDQALFPSSTNYMMSMTSPKLLGIGRNNFDEFLNRYRNELCTSCPTFENSTFLGEFESSIQPKLDLFFGLLDEVREQSKNTVYSIPEPISEPCYTSVVASYGGETLSPSELLQLGEKELRRVEEYMYSLIDPVSESQSHEEKVLKINEYLKVLAESGSQTFDSSEEYLNEIDTFLKHSFTFLPKVSSFTVFQPKVEDVNYETNSFVETYSADKATIYVNSKAPSSKFTLASAIVHEAVPGHHLERQHNKTVEKSTEFENNFFPGDFVEGWAFYMEEFADEIGIYRNADERLGYLEEIRIRALRLIIPYRFFFDKWSEDKAREFSMEHSVMPEFRLNSETGRNSHWRGQVLSYMLGKDTIIQMRIKAEKELGESFSIIKFHDFLIGNGNIHLRSLQAMLDDWIVSQRNEN